MPRVDVERFRADLREGGVEEMVGTLLATFAQDCPGRFAVLEQAVQQGNAKDEYLAVLHELKTTTQRFVARVKAALRRAGS